MKKLFTILSLVILLTGCKSLDEPEAKDRVISESIMSTLEESKRITKQEWDNKKALGEKLAKEHIYYKEVNQGGQMVSAAFLKELPSSKVIESRTFDRCGDEDAYKDYPWHDALKSNLDEIARQPEYINLSFYRHNPNPFFEPPIVEMCVSLDQKFAIGIYGADYCSSGFIFRYNINEDVIEVAKPLDDYIIGCHSSFTEFGKRNGDIIPVKSFFGDAGHTGRGKWDFNFSENTLKQKESCNTSYVFEDKNGNGKPDQGEETYEESCESF